MAKEELGAEELLALGISERLRPIAGSQVKKNVPNCQRENPPAIYQARLGTVLPDLSENSTGHYYFCAEKKCFINQIPTDHGDIFFLTVNERGEFILANMVRYKTSVRSGQIICCRSSCPNCVSIDDDEKVGVLPNGEKIVKV